MERFFRGTILFERIETGLVKNNFSKRFITTSLASVEYRSSIAWFLMALNETVRLTYCRFLTGFSANCSSISAVKIASNPLK